MYETLWRIVYIVWKSYLCMLMYVTIQRVHTIQRQQEEKEFESDNSW